MPQAPSEAASAGVANRNRLMRLLVASGTAMLLLLALALGSRAQGDLLASLEQTALETRVLSASTLAAQQASLATHLATHLATLVKEQAGETPTARGNLRVARQRGLDATEFIASDARTQLAVGGLLALAAMPAATGQTDAIARLIGSLPEQQLRFKSEPEVEAIYVMVPRAQVVSRVPYVDAEHLRQRQGEASLASWFARDVFAAPSGATGESRAEAWFTSDPFSGATVLRVDQSAWLGASTLSATVSVTVTVRAYVRRLAAAASPVKLIASLVAPDGSVAATASRSAAEVTTLGDLPIEIVRVIPSLGGRFSRVGSWFALMLPIEGTRFSAVVAVPVVEIVATTLRRVAWELLLVLAAAGVLGLFVWIARRRVLEPAHSAVRDLAAAASLVREIADTVPGLAVFKVVRDDNGSMSVEFVSRGALAVLGVPAVAIASDWEHVFETVVSADVPTVRADCERALVECVPWQREFRVRRRDEERWVRVEARASRVGATTELVGSWRDVTEGRVHSELLADAQRRLIDVADGVPGAVIQWRVTADGRQVVAFVGSRLPEIAGIGTSDLYGGLHTFEQVQLAEDVDAVRRARQQAVVSGVGYAVEYRVMHPGRGMRWLREEAVSHSLTGFLAAFTVHLTDVTQQRKEAGELRRAKEEAETAARSKSAFLATMSHEIRTPMTGISGMIEVLARTVLDADQRSQLATVSESARALGRILDDVLDFSRIEAGKMTVELRPMSVDDVIEATAGLYAVAANEKGVRLRATVDPQVGELVMGDAVRLRHVLGNLLSNAIKFTAHGTVRLAVSEESVTETHRLLVFEVTDTGVGIPYDVQPLLFQPFERGEHEITTQVGGTGLGLALVRRIVDLMGGAVVLRSLPGVGTSVQVRMSFERVREESSVARISLGGLRVAVLHDSEFDARFVASLLEGRGATVLMVPPENTGVVPEGTGADVIVIGPDVPKEAQHSLRARLAAGSTGRIQVVRLFDGGSLRPEVRGDGGVTLAPHARRSTLLRAVAIAAGRDEPDLPSVTAEHRAGGAPESATVNEAIAERRLILVCEDHPIAQRVIEKQLRVLGYTAELHNNGHSGLTAWRSGRYGLVLTDLQMPEMDGLTLARRIRAEEGRDSTLGRTPIIALSGNAYDEQRVVCVEAGMDDFLGKPALLKELDATLRFWLPPSSRPATGASKAVASTALPVTLPAPLSHKTLKESLGDDPEVLRVALGEFLEADAEDIAALLASFEADDREQVVRSAHRIEGAARMLGALPYARAAERVKRLFGLEQRADERRDAVVLLQQEGERLRTWLHTTRDWFERATVNAAG